MYYLTIDLGTSGPKVVLFDKQLNAISDSFKETPFYLFDGGGAEQNPDEWWTAIVDATKEVIQVSGVQPSDISAINVTTQWSGTVAVDRNGEPLMNCINWMDSRGAKYIKKMVGGFPEIAGYNLFKVLKWIHLTGGAPTHSGKDPIAHILYIKEELPEIYQQTHKFLEPKDYINFKLTGQFAASYESITLHWITNNRNINKVTYSNELLKIAGIQREKLPDLRPSVEVLDKLSDKAAGELGLNTSIPVVMGTPDIHSAAVGSGAIQDFEGHIYIGTSSWIGSHVPFKKTDLAHNIATLPSALPSRYLIVNEQETAGEIIKFLSDNILFANDALHVDRPQDFYKKWNDTASCSPAGANGLFFLPWVFGERSPIDESFLRGGLINLSLQHNRSDMARAAMEGVAMNARWLLKYVEKMAGRPFEWINLIGGGAQSDLWCQIYADICNRTIRRVKNPILCNARGAAMLAALATGSLSKDEVEKQVPIEKEFHPNPENRTLYDNKFKDFVSFYKANKKIFKHLNS